MSPSGSLVPHVSVVICTYNRPSTIRQAVESVLANDYPAFDLTVVDQSATAATENILLPLMERDSRLQYLHLEKPGVSRARNTGVTHTTGEIIAFTDDDCVVPQTWLRTIARAFSENEDIDMLYGQVIAGEIGPVPGSVTPALRFDRQERFSRKDGFRIFGMSANFAARRRLFAAIRGFDEMLGPGRPLCSGEDFDLAYRAYLAGRTILLSPEVQVTHYGMRGPQDWAATLRAYGIGDGAFYWKHVRCRDLFALRLLAEQLFMTSARVFAHRLLGEHRTEMTYVRHVLIGIRKCSAFAVDRRMRLYIPRQEAAP